MSNKEIKLAIIPAAGLGTRMLPISHAVPKEMLPIVDRPAISYLVEECVKSGITDILIITNRDKDAIEDYFDYSPEYEEHLRAGGKIKQLQYIRDCADSANIYFLRQHQARGLGHAVRRAKKFTGDEPFAVLYGDDIIFADKPVTSQLTDAFNKYKLPCVGVKEVSTELIKKYCALTVDHLEGGVYRVKNMIEKPKDEAVITSHLSVLGRVLLTPVIYDILDQTPPGANGEIQLTDAMGTLSRSQPDGGIIAVDFDGKRYDMGSKLGFIIANVEQAVNNEEIGEDVKRFLQEFVGNGFKPTDNLH